MPELPEVEVLVRHLRPLLRNQTVRGVNVRRAKTIAPATPRDFARALRGAEFMDVSRRGKYLVFALRRQNSATALRLVGHLGMTGRMYLAPVKAALPKHAAVVFDLGQHQFIFEDTRYFGRLTLDSAGLEKLGPEPLETEAAPGNFAQALQRSAQAVKIKLLDQSLVAGVGNIYASEALFRAGISPLRPARRLTEQQVKTLWDAVREVLDEAIRFGSTVPLSYSGAGRKDRLFYFGRAAEAPDFYAERLRVYDRQGQACPDCGTAIRRVVQAGRSTFYCPQCQR